MQNPDRDSLLEHLARLHFDTTARARSAGGVERCRATPTARAARSSRSCSSGATASRCSRRSAALIRSTTAPRPRTCTSRARSAALACIHVPGCGPLGDRELVRRRAPAPLPAVARARRVRAAPPRAGRGPRGALPALLAENGGSIAGAFYGIWSFPDSGDHLCVCGRVSTEHLTGPDLAYVLNSVFALAEAHREEL